MATLFDVLQLIYNTEKQCISFVKILAYRGVFTDPVSYVAGQTYDSITVQQKHLQLAQRIEDIWKKVFFHASRKDLNHVISDADAKEFLATTFPSLKAGFDWLHHVCDIFLLRRSFFAEGIGHDNEIKQINTAKWEAKLAQPVQNLLEKPDTVEAQLYEQCQNLGMINESCWPDNPIKQVVFFSSLENGIIQRIGIIPRDYQGKIYCLTGPRGLFNFESALPDILAEWFQQPSRVSEIRKVLSMVDTSQQWTLDLSKLKKTILKQLDIDTWPMVKDSYYYRDQAIYDKAADEAKREHLDCLGGPWPVALDLIHYYLKSHLIYFNEKNIIPVVALGKRGRLTGVDEEVETWYQCYGKELFEQNVNPIFLACNNIHTLPFILRNLISQSQPSFVKMDLRNKARQFSGFAQEVKKSLDKIIIIGPKAKQFNLQHALDCIAKEIYCLKTHFDEFSLEKELRDQGEYLSSVGNLKRMAFYHQCRDHLKLANSSFDLSLSFHHQGDLIKTSGLMNFSQNVLKKMDENVGEAIEDIYQCSLINLKQFLVSQKSAVDVHINTLRAMDSIYRTTLLTIRQTLRQEYEIITELQPTSIIRLYQHCFNKMKALLIDMIKKSGELLAIDIMRMAFACLGSYSRLQTTPFSDLESFVLTTTDRDEDINAAKKITKMLLMLILNLGETVTSSLGIIVRDHRGKEYSLAKMLFDDYTPQGLSFDRYNEMGSKTPLGKKQDGHVVYRLIGTPATMVKEFASDAGYQKDIVFPQLMRSSAFICGNSELYHRYLSFLSQSTLNTQIYGRVMLANDIEKLSSGLMPTKAIIHKNQFYRPIAVVIEDLFTVLNQPGQLNAWQKTALLCKHKLINVEQQEFLFLHLAFVLYLRLKQHFKFSEQKTEILSGEVDFPVVRHHQTQMLKFFGFFRERLIENETKQMRAEARLLAKSEQKETAVVTMISKNN